MAFSMRHFTCRLLWTKRVDAAGESPSSIREMGATQDTQEDIFVIAAPALTALKRVFKLKIGHGRKSAAGFKARLKYL